MDRFRHAAMAVAVAGSFLLSGAAFAATSVAQDAQALIDSGKPDAALTELNEHLKTNPQDAEARFTKGIALVKLNRSQDAIRVFADLTRDYPQLPEPYNNLAVLYAAQGDYEKARDALQAAIAKHPGYATAHENLGDIYAALATAAYSKAASLDTANQAVRRKLAVLNQLDTGIAGPSGGVSSLPAAPAAPAPMPAAKTSPASAPPPPAAVAPGPTKPATPSAPSPRDSAALAAVQQWAKAWASQDVDVYLGMYAPEFQPEGGISRDTWAAQRRNRVSTPKHIEVDVVDPKATDIEDGAVQVTFKQNYKSDDYSDAVDKVLELVPVNGSWKIVREYTR
ncbi:L,D-transpeptidase Cds6 family protein [Solimonas marina]|uniref:Tetratricopeptide repeat protein n=1 Tax=Solimonas marina TaxID=2714601 RepID=A0A969W5H0_9GAMM|nr:tetratricopeptide repeat protein [Solimonas marina]NKF21041.1 tetratricopeptide repeat protein [Solimonas marina]